MTTSHLLTGISWLSGHITGVCDPSSLACSTQFFNNTAQSGGALGLSQVETLVTIADCSFTNNAADV